jgi:hypothetical protein
MRSRSDGFEPPAEEGDRLLNVRHQGSDATDVPDVVLVQGSLGRNASLGVALVGKFPVPVDRMVAASVQFSAHRGLACSGDALDEMVRTPIRTGSSPLQGEPTSYAAGGAVELRTWPDVAPRVDEGASRMVWVGSRCGSALDCDAAG